MKLYEKIWHRPLVDAVSSKALAEQLDIRIEIAEILLKRGITTAEQAERFLYATPDDLYDPLEMHGMEKAVQRIRRAMDSGEKIMIYGDYDVDGISSISLLLHFFKLAQYEVDFYIPNRQEEGYGINVDAIQSISENGYTVIITVDCGITAVEEAQKAKELGVDMIITDHHEPQKVLPDCYSLINPKQENCNYPYDMLAGVGIAFKLVQALMGETFAQYQERFLEIAALGTVADVAPVLDENRIITKYGLAVMNDTVNPGLKALVEATSLESKTITCGHIGFVLAPKINAAGRIGNPELGVELLTTDSEAQAETIAQQLCDLNEKRQNIERSIIEESERFVAEHLDPVSDRVLVIEGHNWHTGIIGIVASRIAEKYYRPTVIVNIEDGIAKGSARSVGDFNIFEALSACSDLFDKFGGHEQAAGLSLQEEHVSTLRKQINEWTEPRLTDRDLTPVVRLDGYIRGRHINHKLLDELSLLEPYGVGNPRPQFAIHDLVVDKVRRIGKDLNHVKMIVHDENRVFDAIQFGCGDKYDHLNARSVVDMAATLELNQFRGVETIQFMIQDIRTKGKDARTRLQSAYAQALAEYLIQGPPPEMKGIDLPPLGETIPEGTTAVLVEEYDALESFVEKYFDQLDFKYAIHSNTIQRTGTFDLLVHPTDLTGLDQYDWVVRLPKHDESEMTKMLREMLPDRDQLVVMYKLIRKQQQASLSALCNTLRLSNAQARLQYKVLLQAALIEEVIEMDELHLRIVPAPTQKIDMNDVPLFKKIRYVYENGLDDLKICP